MSKQWIFVGLVVAGLAAGATIMTQLGTEVQPVEVGAAAPRISGWWISPPATRCPCASATAGKVTLVNIWATWCVPCRVEMPSMEQALRLAGAAGLRDRGGEHRRGRSRRGAAVRAASSGSRFDLLQDRSTRIQQIYQTTGVPESFLLDRHGVIVKRIIGAHDWNSPANRALVERLLDGARHLT